MKMNGAMKLTHNLTVHTDTRGRERKIDTEDYKLYNSSNGQQQKEDGHQKL